MAAWRAMRVVAERGGRNRSDTLEAPFVGRDDELRLLKDLFHATARAAGAAGLRDRPGRHRQDAPGLGVPQVHRRPGRAASGGTRAAARPTAMASPSGRSARWSARGPACWRRDDEPTTRAKIAETLDEHVPDDGRAPLDRAGAARPAWRRGRTSRPQQLFGAWRTFFERLAASAPVVMVFEDFHYADPGLLDFMDHLLEWTQGMPIYVVTLARPELFESARTGAPAKRSFTSHLSRPAVRDAQMRRAPGRARARFARGRTSRRSSARADGVPLYAVETVRMLLARRPLTARGRGLRARPGPRRPGRARDAHGPDRGPARQPRRRPIGRWSPTPPSSARASRSRRSPDVSGVEPAALEPRLRTSIRREILDRRRGPALARSVVSTRSCRPLSAKSPTTRSRKKDRKTRHLAAARYLRGAGLGRARRRPSWLTTLPRHRTRPKGPRPMPWPRRRESR